MFERPLSNEKYIKDDVALVKLIQDLKMRVSAPSFSFVFSNIFL